jgi:hypothetical protein
MAYSGPTNVYGVVGATVNTNYTDFFSTNPACPLYNCGNLKEFSCNSGSATGKLTLSSDGKLTVA